MLHNGRKTLRLLCVHVRRTCRPRVCVNMRRPVSVCFRERSLYKDNLPFIKRCFKRTAVRTPNAGGDSSSPGRSVNYGEKTLAAVRLEGIKKM